MKEYKLAIVSQSQTQRTAWGSPRGGGRKRDGWGSLPLDWISNETLLHRTGNCVRCLGTEHDGRQPKEGNVDLCMPGSLCCTAGIGTTL